ncbi:MAG: hypothetical protein IKC72_06925 [Clostridia bacterium]|nr:hypothetical protein [Clostridia bacterium]
MSRESKILNAGLWGAEKTIHHYESFGWELLSLNGQQITMTRETQNPVYSDLVKFQAKYEELVLAYSSVKYPAAPEKPAPFSLKRCLILLLLAVIPGAAYIAYKIVQNNKYKEAVQEYENKKAECNAKKEKIAQEIEQTINDSRATFFGKQ